MKRKQKLPFEPKVFLSKVNGGRTLSDYRKNQIVYAQGDPADSVFYIQSGKAKKIVVSEQGKEAVVALFGAGDFFGKRWVADVRWYQIFPQLRMIPHPRCICDTDMCLTCIEPDGLGHDRRIFECPRCKHWTVEIIKYRAKPIDIPTACPLPIP